MQQKQVSQQPTPGADAATENAVPAPDDSSIDPDDQSWFWTQAWQAAEAAADRDKAEGRVTRPTAEDIRNRIRALGE